MTKPQTESASLSNILRYNISSQLVGRLFTFLINIYLIRFVDGDVLGLINVRLTLLYTTIGFLCTEPLRKTCLSADLRVHEAVKYAWLSPVFGFGIASFLAVIWSHLPVQGGAVAYDDYEVLVFYFAFAAFLETMAEPLAIMTIKTGDNATYAISLSVLLISNKFTVLLLLLYGVESKSVLCLGQIVGSVIYTLIYYVKFIRAYLAKRLNYLPWPHLRMGYDMQHLKSIGALLFHSVQKQLITEGAAYIMTFTQQLSFTEQAVYDAIDRLGSLVTRIVLRPLEESCAVYFSSHFERNRTSIVPPKLLELFKTLCRILITLGLVVCVFSIPYSKLAVTIYGGKLLTENQGALLLSMYSFFLVVMAVNGTVECFAFSTLDASSIMKHARFLLIASVVHLFANIVLLKMIGASGFIVANIAHMLFRIGYNWRDIKRLPNAHMLEFSSVLPDMTFFTLLLVSLVITGLSGLIFATTPGLVYTGAHLAVGGVMFILIMAYLHQNGELYQKLWEKLD
ncbi:Protein RFT1-like protein [Aphelenchoides bicaudatus]|nr:Protein RFT1-like protein [Aphelenchoides bicaudatus]